MDESITPVDFLCESADSVQSTDLRGILNDAADYMERGYTPAEFAAAMGWHRGVSGFINHTVPAALYCWLSAPDDFRTAVESAITLGGDTDTVGAITGALAGTSLGPEAIPTEWIDGLMEWPRDVKWMRRLAGQLAEVIAGGAGKEPLPMRWPATLVRNGFFASIVVALALRRMLPPY